MGWSFPGSCRFNWFRWAFNWVRKASCSFHALLLGFSRRGWLPARVTRMSSWWRASVAVGGIRGFLNFLFLPLSEADLACTCTWSFMVDCTSWSRAYACKKSRAQTQWESGSAGTEWAQPELFPLSVPAAPRDSYLWAGLSPGACSSRCCSQLASRCPSCLALHKKCCSESPKSTGRDGWPLRWDPEVTCALRAIEHLSGRFVKEQNSWWGALPGRSGGDGQSCCSCSECCPHLMSPHGLLRFVRVLRNERVTF